MVELSPSLNDESLFLWYPQGTEPVLPEAKPLNSSLNQKKGWFKKLGSTLSSLLGGKKIDDELLDEFEDHLIVSDIAPSTASKLRLALEEKFSGSEITAQDIETFLIDRINEILRHVQSPICLPVGDKPALMIFVGVNGSGKTTTIGKMADKLTKQGKKVLLVAGDTFRAAAVEQLQVWADRTGAAFIGRGTGADAAGLVHDAWHHALEAKVDVVLVDTAGRLQNRQGLMDELRKIIRVVRKLDADLPHHILLVLDGSTGQNALSQVDIFREMADISGLIMTKLDGTAKGGILVSLADKFRFPIHAIGVGEATEDLQAFDAETYAVTLVSGLSQGS